MARLHVRPWLLRVLLVLVIAVGGTFLGLRLAGPSTHRTQLGTVSLRVHPAWRGEVEAFIPIADWGVRAHAFRGPLRLHVEPRSVDRQALLAAASGDRHVLDRAESDGRTAARVALIRAIPWAAGGALALAIAAALALRGWPVRVRVGVLVAPALLAALLTTAAVLRVKGTFDPKAFEQPSFYARGAELTQLLKVADTAQASARGYRSSIDRTLAGYASLLNAGAGLARPENREPAVVMSDLHANELVLRPLRRLFSGRPIFFVGDFGQRGTPTEARVLIPQVRALGRTIVAVSGNHDSAFFMRRLAAAGVTVLTDRGQARRIGGLLVAGYPDPLEWRGRNPDDPRRVFSFAERPDGKAEFARARARLVRWFEALRPRPDVVLVHQNGLAQGLATAVRAERRGDPLLILTGHDHKQHVDRYGDVLVVDGGTVGAGGVFGVGDQSVGMAQVHLPAGGVRPRAVDLVQVEPLSGSAGANRLIPYARDACEREDFRCH